MNDMVLKERSIDNVRVFWEKSKDEELQRLFPFIDYSLDEAIRLYEESLKPGATSYGQTIYAGEKYIGDVWCYSIDEKDEKLGFISIVIFDKEYWGHGAGLEALNKFCRLVFQKFSIDKLCAFTYKSNTRSVRTLEKAGFVLKEEFMEDGVSSYYFELSKEIV